MGATGDSPEAVDLVLNKPVAIEELRQAIIRVMNLAELDYPHPEATPAVSRDSLPVLTAT